MLLNAAAPVPRKGTWCWRLGSESNRRRRLCRPLWSHGINGLRAFCHTLTPAEPRSQWPVRASEAADSPPVVHCEAMAAPCGPGIPDRAVNVRIRPLSSRAVRVNGSLWTRILETPLQCSRAIAGSVTADARAGLRISNHVSSTNAPIAPTTPSAPARPPTAAVLAAPAVDLQHVEPRYVAK